MSTGQLSCQRGKTTLIDFDSAPRRASASELEKEFRSLQSELRDTSARGAKVVDSEP